MKSAKTIGQVTNQLRTPVLYKVQHACWCNKRETGDATCSETRVSAISCGV